MYKELVDQSLHAIFGFLPVIMFGIWAAPAVLIFAYMRELWQKGLFQAPLNSVSRQFNSAGSWRDLTFWEVGVVIALILLNNNVDAIFL